MENYSMKSYEDLWLMRRDAVDCYTCNADIDPPSRDSPRPGECCSFTGLEPIPWEELFSWNPEFRRTDPMECFGL